MAAADPARLLARALIVLAVRGRRGRAAALIGWAVADLQCTGDCEVQTGVGRPRRRRPGRRRHRRDLRPGHPGHGRVARRRRAGAGRAELRRQGGHHSARRGRRPSSSTSRWVTKRTAPGPSVAAQHALLGQRLDHAASGPAWAKTTMLVSTVARVDGAGEALGHGLAQAAGPSVVVGQAVDHRVEGERGRRRPGSRPGACPPPSRVRWTRASAMRSAGPASTEPTGAPRPLLMQQVTVVAGAASSATGTPRATAALNSRAPSRCTGGPRAATARQLVGGRRPGRRRPCGCSRPRSPPPGASGRCRRRRRPRPWPGRGDRRGRRPCRAGTPPLTPAAPISDMTTCWRRPATTIWPGPAKVRSATWLAMVPEGTNSPAALPTRSAKVSSSRRTVGSSPQPSSPTSAAAMAARMASVGRVIVSERRSTRGTGRR